MLEYQAPASAKPVIAQTQFKRGVHVLVDSDEEITIDDNSPSERSKSVSISSGSSPASGWPSPAVGNRPSPGMGNRPSPSAGNYRPTPAAGSIPSPAAGNRPIVTASTVSSPWLSKERNVAPARCVFKIFLFNVISEIMVHILF